MSDTVRLGFEGNEDGEIIALFQVGPDYDGPTIDVNVHWWAAISGRRRELEQDEAPLLAQAQATYDAWQSSRPRSTMFPPGIQQLMVDTVTAALSRNEEFAASVHRQCPDAKGGLTIDVRLPERYRK